jgi:hypothetical protein
MGFDNVDGNTPNIVNTSVKRTRRYLTGAEDSASRRHRLMFSRASAAAQ